MILPDVEFKLNTLPTFSLVSSSVSISDWEHAVFWSFDLQYPISSKTAVSRLTQCSFVRKNETKVSCDLHWAFVGASRFMHIRNKPEIDRNVLFILALHTVQGALFDLCVHTSCPRHDFIRLLICSCSIDYFSNTIMRGLNVTNISLMYRFSSIHRPVDPDLELWGEGAGLVLLALRAFFPLWSVVISSFFTQNKGVLQSSPRSSIADPRPP